MSHEPEDKTRLVQAIWRVHEDPNPLTVQSTRFQFYCVVAAVQLASRHPNFNGPTSKVAIQWARDLADALAANDPDLSLLVAMGWEQTLDDPIGT